MNCNAPIPGPRGDRNWFDDGPAQIHAPGPGGPDPIWRGMLLGFAVTLVIGLLVVAYAWSRGWFA